MQILVITPLFPPDASTPAVYAKELVSGLSTQTDIFVTCLHYGHHPEVAKHATIVSIQKNVTAFWRLLLMAKMIFGYRKFDIIILLNGQSVELPYLLMRPWISASLIYIDNDIAAAKKAGSFKSYLRKKILKHVKAHIIPEDTLQNRPVIHPLINESKSNFDLYSSQWNVHVNQIVLLCQN